MPSLVAIRTAQHYTKEPHVLILYRMWMASWLHSTSSIISDILTNSGFMKTALQENRASILFNLVQYVPWKRLKKTDKKRNRDTENEKKKKENFT